MIPSQSTKIIYLGDGTTTSFPFNFKYSAGDDVKVAIYEVATDTTTVLERDYFVDTNANIVKYPGYPPGEEPALSDQPEPLPSGYKLVIYRETPITQEVDLGSKYPLNTLEKMDDKAILICQELAEKMTRTLVVEQGSELTPRQLVEELRENTALAVASASAASISENNAGNSATAAYNSAVDAAGSKDRAEDILADIEAAAETVGGVATVYDPNKQYEKANQVMVENGDTYRCIEPSLGEYPPTSGKWVLTATGKKDTFERDEDDDLVPCRFAQASDLWSIDNDEDICPRHIA
ncbi:MAG: hypothetical protein J6N55_00860 [Anaerovibrio sp.]|uniref:hypothetical protein n=1 Tax=Anaerovibrio sp. TaxID=1872532 RepID=UPI001B03DDC8|nr:hypothetical protein [Anaerovibrio sp.]MBO6244815.1 hypothetical protein [Anaerovibrio sp.]